MFMTNQVYEIEIYSDDKGKKPFTEWLESIEKADRARIKARLDRILIGNMGDYRHIESEIHELRFKNHSGFRIYYAKEDNTIVILLNAGNKDTQNKDIERAKYYWKDYNKRKAGV
jgi:putative addiction module killer protein